MPELEPTDIAIGQTRGACDAAFLSPPVEKPAVQIPHISLSAFLSRKTTVTFLMYERAKAFRNRSTIVSRTFTFRLYRADVQI